MVYYLLSDFIFLVLGFDSKFTEYELDYVVLLMCIAKVFKTCTSLIQIDSKEPIKSYTAIEWAVALPATYLLSTYLSTGLLGIWLVQMTMQYCILASHAKNLI